MKIVKNLNFAMWKKIERSVFFYWTTTDKLEFTDWSEVHRRLGSGEIAIFRLRGLKTPPTMTKRVNYH